MASMNDRSLSSFAVDNIKPQVDPLVFLLRHGVIGWASDALQNLGYATGLLSLEMSRSFTCQVRGLKVRCRADPRALGLSVRRIFLSTFISAPCEVQGIPGMVCSS